MVHQPFNPAGEIQYSFNFARFEIKKLCTFLCSDQYRAFNCMLVNRKKTMLTELPLQMRPEDIREEQ